MSRQVTLLGPQPRPHLHHALADLDPEALVATVTAGWQDREGDDAELSEAVGFRTVNLALHARWLAVHEEDREYGYAEREHEAALAELRELYLAQLDHALSAAYDVARRSDARPRMREQVLADALRVVQLLDEQHLQRLTEFQLKFFDVWRPHERPAVVRHRVEIQQALEGSSAVAIAGGHVGELTRVLHLFHVAPYLPARVVAWSAGAMALTERVVLFHDFVPHGVAQTEVYGTGIGVVPGVVAAPSRPASTAGERPDPDVAPGASVRARPVRGSRRRHADAARREPPTATGRPGAGRRGAHRHTRGGMTESPPKRKLAINRLRDRKPLDAQTVDRFLARHEVPIVEESRCTFLFRGEADDVSLIQRVVGLPEQLPMRRLRGTDLWYLVLELPERSRVNYQLEVRRGEDVERFNDPLNPKVSYSPVGTSSVCFAHGYESPEWTEPDPTARQGTLEEIVVPSRALRRDCPVTLYLPARFRRTSTYPLLVVHDGPDFLQYAAAKTVLDNLIDRSEVAETVVAFLHPKDRLTEYANSTAHSRFLTQELLPRLETRLPLTGRPSGRCLLGSSFGGVASLSAAVKSPTTYGSLILMSGSFVFTDIGQRPRRRTGLRPGGQVRQPLPGEADAGRRPGLRELRRLRTTDHAQPLDGADLRVHRHVRALRRDPGRTQLGELARHASRRPVLGVPRGPEVRLRVTGRCQSRASAPGSSGTSTAFSRSASSGIIWRARSFVEASTTGAGTPSPYACSQRSATTHHRSPGLRPGKPHSGRGVVRSLPTACWCARNSSVMTAHTACTPRSSGPHEQLPSR